MLEHYVKCVFHKRGLTSPPLAKYLINISRWNGTPKKKASFDAKFVCENAQNIHKCGKAVTEELKREMSRRKSIEKRFPSSAPSAALTNKNK